MFVNPLYQCPETLAGYGAMAMIRKGKIHTIDRHDMRAQGAFVAGLFAITV